MQSALQRNLKYIIPLILIVFTALLISYFINNKPPTKVKKKKPSPPIKVAVLDIAPQSFKVNIDSYGTVSPRTQSFLVSQVSGEITYISNKLREGSFFEKGDILLRIDDRDYVADVKISEANLADAQQALSEEMALSSQAALDWKNLGNQDTPNDLVLRKPQQQAAKARLESAQAALTKTELTLERTKITAPYSGRVLNKQVDLGQVTSTNSQIAEIYATDYFEIRLPLRTVDLKFIDLPKSFRNKEAQAANASVEIHSSLTDKPIPWSGRIVRAESAIDSSARQLHVVAQIDDPFNASILERPPLKIGEYVTAKIEGKIIEDAIVIPSKSIYQDTYVYVVEGDIIKRQTIDILWQDDSQSLIKSGLDVGQRLVLTTLGQISSGTRAEVEGDVVEGNVVKENAKTAIKPNSKSQNKNNKKTETAQ